jgi:hypothetical protein
MLPAPHRDMAKGEERGLAGTLCHQGLGYLLRILMRKEEK